MSKNNLEFLTEDSLNSLHSCLETSLKILSEQYHKSASDESVKIQALHESVNFLRELTFEADAEIDRRNSYPKRKSKQIERYNGSF